MIEDETTGSIKSDSEDQHKRSNSSGRQKPPLVDEVEQLKRSQSENWDKYKLTFEHAPEAIVLLDEKGTIVDINGRIQDWLGYDPMDLIGKNLFRVPFITYKSKKKALQKFKETFNGIKHDSYELEFVTVYSELKIGEVRTRRISDPDKNFVLDIAWVKDITSLRLTEEALAESKGRYKLLTESATELIFTHDLSGNITFANKAAIHLSGYKASELYKMNINDLLIPDKTLQSFSDDITDSKDLHLFEVICFTKTGKEIPLEASSVSFNIQNHGEEKLIIARDITDRRFVELALRESEQRFRSLYENSSLGIYQTTPNGKFILANDAMIKMLGFTSFSELANYNIEDGYIDKAQREKFKEEMGKNGIVNGFEVEWKTKEGEIVYIREISRAVTDSDDKVIYYEGSCENITSAKLAEIKSREQNEIMKAVRFAAEAFLQSHHWRDPVNEILSRLGAAAKVSRIYVFQNSNTSNGSLSTSQLYEWTDGSVPERINNPVYKNLFYEQLECDDLLNTLEQRKIFQSDVCDLSHTFKTLLNEEQTKSFLVVPIFVKDSLWGFTGIDECKYKRKWTPKEIESLRTAAETMGAAIERSETEKKLIAAKEAAEKSDKLKSEFLAQISHEIRTPINAILSFSDLLLDEVKDKVDDDLKSSFSILESAGKRITRTVDLILNMSEIQAGTYELFKEPFNLYSESILPLINEYKNFAAVKGIELILINESDSSVIEADKYSVTQIFSNLIDNAIKYTKEGKIEVKISNVKNSVIVSVADTGIGMSKKYLKQLFSAFTQEDTGYTRSFEGTGLGLALIKNYCEMNSIDISVESEKGSGTTFTLTTAIYSVE